MIVCRCRYCGNIKQLDLGDTWKCHCGKSWKVVLNGDRFKLEYLGDRSKKASKTTSSSDSTTLRKELAEMKRQYNSVFETLVRIKDAAQEFLDGDEPYGQEALVEAVEWAKRVVKSHERKGERV